MKKIRHIAAREWLGAVSTRTFMIGLLIVPAIAAAGLLIAPLFFSLEDFPLQGEVAVVDPTGLVAQELRNTLAPQRIAARRKRQAEEALAEAPAVLRRYVEPSGAGGSALETVPLPDLYLTERKPTADPEKEKEWLNAVPEGPRHLALVVIHSDAAVLASGQATYGTYDLYVPPNLDDRAEDAIRQGLEDALINARVRARALDRDALDAITSVPYVRSITVTRDAQHHTVQNFNLLLPAAFGALLLGGVVVGGQSLLASTVEEKSSRVMEVLLSAVSPMELMAGKLLGQMAVSLVVMSVYLAMGLAALTSSSLLALIDLRLIFYLAIFFVITYLVIGSLMMAAGAAVDDEGDAESLKMPIMAMLLVPWILWMPISRDPNSTFSTAISFIPPVNTFAMLLRMTSVAPPPLWQVWLSIAIGVVSVFGAVWFAAKVFRIGLLMYGKPPNLATLVRWARAA